MAEDNVATNGHRPPRRQRKHIYPPPAQMVAEQAAAAARPRTVRAVRLRAAESAFGPEAETPPAPPMMAAAIAPDEATEMAMTQAVDEDGSSLDGERVELRMSAVGMVDAADVSFAQGALGAARADNITVEQGVLGAALANTVSVSRGYARSILARNVQLDNAAARVIVAADVKAERSAVMFLVARRVAGDVRVLLDWRGAIAFGAVAGAVIGLLRRRQRP